MKKSGIFTQLVAGISFGSVLLLWASAGSVYVSPLHCRFLPLLGLAFPFFLTGTVLLLLFSLLFCRRAAWVPFVGLLLCYYPIRSYCPLNFNAAPPRGALKIMTYNTLGFANQTKEDDGVSRTAAYIMRSQPDIVFLQETWCKADFWEKSFREPLRSAGYYVERCFFPGSSLTLVSRFPVARQEVICKAGGNGAACFYIPMADGDTLLAVNCHLTSMHLSTADRENFASNVNSLRNTEPESVHASFFKDVAAKIARSSQSRAHQADSVADFLRRNASRRLLVCGDFNDTPVSYTCHTIRNAAPLTDCFRATGNGIGRSFNRNAMVVRIDHALCADGWFKPYAARFDTECHLSDHYPLTFWLENRRR